jgi:hypothetical protein
MALYEKAKAFITALLSDHPQFELALLRRSQFSITNRITHLNVWQGGAKSLLADPEAIQYLLERASVSNEQLTTTINEIDGEMQAIRQTLLQQLNELALSPSFSQQSLKIDDLFKQKTLCISLLTPTPKSDRPQLNVAHNNDGFVELSTATRAQAEAAWPDIRYHGHNLFDLYLSAMDDDFFHGEDFEGQECYLAYSPSNNLFYSGWDEFTDGETHSKRWYNVVTFSIDAQTGKFHNVGGVVTNNQLFYQSDAKARISEQAPDLMELRLN